MNKKFLGLCFLIGLVIFSFNIQAAITLIRPDGAGHYSQWLKRGCISNWACVNEGPISTSDHLFTYVLGKKESFSFSDPLIPSQHGIGGVTLHYVAKGVDDIRLANKIRPLIRIDEQNYLGEEIVLDVEDYDTYSVEYRFNPSNNLPWRESVVDDFEVGVHSSNFPNSGGRVANMYITVEHGKPDLKTEVIVQEFIDGGEVKARVNATVRNDGISRSNSFVVNRRYNPGSQSYTFVEKLDPGEIVDYSFETSCSNGPFDYTLNADYYDYVDEIDESNNLQTVYIDCVI